MVCLFCWHQLFAQKTAAKKQPLNYPYGLDYFDQILTEIKDNDSLIMFKKMLDSVKRHFTMAKNTPFSFSSRWNLVCSDYNGWVDGLSKHRLQIDQCYSSTDENMLFTSEEIFRAFDISEKPLDYFPLVYNRDDHYNAKWTAILPSSEYLIIQMVHSYPDGNATSWLKTRTYYFQKEIN
jgi:hypothetical protein